jgi:stage III sporulation protein AE
MSVLNLCDAMSDEMRVGRMLGAIRRIYNFFLCTVMTILVSCLAAQTAISASADGAAARTARLVSGSFIPVLGGSVGETLRTVASGVSYLKNVFGVGGILMIFSLLLPVCVSVLLYRTVFIVCGAIADLFGCASEARLLDGLGEVYGTMLAVITSVSVMFVLALCIFMQSVVAVA